MGTKPHSPIHSHFLTSCRQMPNKSTSSSQKTYRTSTNAGMSQKAGQKWVVPVACKVLKCQAASPEVTATRGPRCPRVNKERLRLCSQLAIINSSTGRPAMVSVHWLSPLLAPWHSSPTGGKHGRTTQCCKGSSQGGTSAPGPQTQYPQGLRWRNIVTPGNQGVTGQGGLPSTSASDLGAGAGGYGVGLWLYDAKALPTLTWSSSRSTQSLFDNIGEGGCHPTEAPAEWNLLEASKDTHDKWGEISKLLRTLDTYYNATKHDVTPIQWLGSGKNRPKGEKTLIMRTTVS